MGWGYLHLESDGKVCEPFVEFIKSPEAKKFVLESGETANIFLNITESSDEGWYMMEDDIVQMSKKFPKIKFCLDYETEDDHHETKFYAWGGKSHMRQSRVIWDEFSYDMIMPLSHKLDVLLNEDNN